MEPIVGANLLHNPVGEMRRQFGDDPSDDAYLDLTGKLLGGGLLSRILGGANNSVQKPDIVDEARRRIVFAPLRAARAVGDELKEAYSQTEEPKQGLFEAMANQFDDIEVLSDTQLQDWKSWFVDKLDGMKVEDVGDFLKSTGIGTLETVREMMGQKISRREFGKGSIAVTSVAAIGMTPLKFTTLMNPSTSETPEESEVEHNNKISRVNLLTSGVVSSVFSGIIGLQFMGKLEMSPKTSAVMVSAWGAKMLALKLDSLGFLGSDDEERHASQAAFDHERAELSNLKIAFLLTGAAEFASHLYLDRYYGKINAEDIWNTISGGERVMVPLNGGSEEVELTFADFEAWMNIEKASDISPERTDIVKRIISGEGLEDISDEEVAGLIEEWVADKRVETTLDKYEDARYEIQLARDRLHGADLWTTVAKINDPETEHIDDLRLAGHIRKWIKQRDGIYDEIPQVAITEQDLSDYLESREAELHTMSHETLDEEILSLEEKIRQGVWKMNAMAAMFAPIALTFTSAGIVNGYMKEMAVRMYELEALRKLKTSGLEADYHEDANKFAVDAMTSKWGLLHLMKALATNIQGAALFGDPPNIFFFQRYGKEEWLKNSAIGFSLSTALSTVETNIFLRKSGLDLTTQNGFGIRDYLSAAGNTVKSMFNTGLQAAAFINEKVTGNSDNLAQKVAKGLKVRDTDYLNIDNESLTKGLPGKAAEMFYLDPLIKTFKRVTSGDIVGGLREVYPDLDHDPEVSNILNEMDPTNFESIDAMKQYLLEKGILEEEKIEKIIEGFEASDMANSHDEHSHGHKLSHAALDVRNALLTQLWAVGSLQVVVKKILKLDQDRKPSKNEALVKIGAILGTIAGISGIADNVAAMLFGIDVLEEIGRKTIGEEEYENNTDFQEALRRWAFLTAVSAGCLTLIGNGPNMVLEVLESVYRKDESDILDAITRKMQMGESAANLHGPASVAVVLACGFGEISYQLNKALGEEAK